MYLYQQSYTYIYATALSGTGIHDIVALYIVHRNSCVLKGGGMNLRGSHIPRSGSISGYIYVYTNTEIPTDKERATHTTIDIFIDI